MQVSSLVTGPSPASDKDASKPATAASDAFAILLQGSFEPSINSGLLRLADASEFAQRLSANRETFAEARPVDDFVAEEPVEYDDEDAAPAPDRVADDSRDSDPTDTVKPDETLAFLTDAPISPDLRISAVGASAAIAALDGGTAAAGQPRATAQQAAVEAVAGTQANPLNDAAAKSGAAGASKNGAADGRIPATVTESGQQLVSRPANTLAAAATLAAQTGKASADATVSTSAPGTNGATGNLLLNDAGGKTAYQGNGQRGASQGATASAATSTDAATSNSNTPSASFAASLAANQTATPAAQARPLPGAERIANSLPLESPPLGGQTSAATGSARPGALPPPPRPATPPGAVKEQIAVQVQKAVAQGVDRISIQLKPAELGRLEIKLDVGQDGRVTALVTVERPDTLELLQRDARGLQQALQDAGLKTDSSGLSFNLRGGDTAPREQAADGGGSANQNGADTTNGDELAEIQDESSRRRASNSLLDVEV